MELMPAGESLDTSTEVLEWVWFVLSNCGRLHDPIDFDLKFSEFLEFPVLLVIGFAVVVVIGILAGSADGDLDGTVVGEAVGSFQLGILSLLSLLLSS